MGERERRRAIALPDHCARPVGVAEDTRTESPAGTLDALRRGADPGAGQDR